MITSISIKGFKSLKSVENLTLGATNILIGANGAGKSNFMGLFRLLGHVYTGDGLQYFVRQNGGANALLHDSAAVTQEMEFHVRFDGEHGVHEYHAQLVYAVSDTLFYGEEQYRYVPAGKEPGRWTDLGHGHLEPKLLERSTNKTALFILGLLRGCKLFQFHNTSVTARMRQRWDRTDDQFLKEDGANLAPVLYNLRERWPLHYRRIEETIRLAFPQFAHFVLEPDGDTIYLRWQERGADLTFGAHQASDGTLRLMALLTLLMLPSERQLKVLLLDEPELGLHPAAIHILAEQIASVSEKTQVIVATQSSLLLDYFSPEEILVVSRQDRSTDIERMSANKLGTWLDDYTLSDLWEKNVLGGRPA